MKGICLMWPAESDDAKAPTSRWLLQQTLRMDADHMGFDIGPLVAHCMHAGCLKWPRWFQWHLPCLQSWTDLWRHRHWTRLAATNPEGWCQLRNRRIRRRVTWGHSSSNFHLTLHLRHCAHATGHVTTTFERTADSRRPVRGEKGLSYCLKTTKKLWISVGSIISLAKPTSPTTSSNFTVFLAYFPTSFTSPTWITTFRKQWLSPKSFSSPRWDPARRPLELLQAVEARETGAEKSERNIMRLKKMRRNGIEWDDDDDYYYY